MAPICIGRTGTEGQAGLQSGMAQNDHFHLWTHDVPCTAIAPVYPDGCRDVLIIQRAGQGVEVRLTPFDLRPRLAALPAGSSLQGFRLRPGTQIANRALRAIKASPEQAATIIQNDLARSDDADHAIHALCLPGVSVAMAARDLGLSPRSLQRLFQRFDLPPPEYWRLLARARRAAAHLAGGAPLAAIAADCGFCDQAHMTRDMARWFGKSPRQLQRDRQTLTLLAQPALGNWSRGTPTGEQISTR